MALPQGAIALSGLLVPTYSLDDIPPTEQLRTLGAIAFRGGQRYEITGDAGSLAWTPVASGSGGTPSSASIDDRIRTLVDSVALEGDADTWPNAKLPADLARDSEVPTLVVTAATSPGDVEPALTSSFKALFLKDNALASVGLGEMRLHMRSYVDWDNAPSGYIFRKGDHTVSASGIFYCLVQHTKSSTRPEGDVIEAVGDGHHWMNILQYRAQYAPGESPPGIIYPDSGGYYLATTHISAGGARPASNPNYVRIDGQDLLADIALDGTELVATRRVGTSKRVDLAPLIPAADHGSVVEVNPDAAATGTLETVSVDGEVWKLPRWGFTFYARPGLTAVEQAAAVDVSKGMPFSMRLLAGVAIPGAVTPGRDFTAEWTGHLFFTFAGNGSVIFTMTTTHVFNGKTLVSQRVLKRRASRNVVDSLALNNFNSVSSVATGSFEDDNGNTIEITDADLLGPTQITIDLSVEYEEVGGGQNRAEISAVTSENIGVRFWQLPTVADDVVEPGTPRPQISTFRVVSGDTTPAPGPLNAEGYLVEWSLAQGHTAGSARIVFFDEMFDPANVEVIYNIPREDLTAGFARPQLLQTTLAEGERVGLRLQVYDADVTSPTNSDTPAATADILIVAHNPATAAYRTGYLISDETDMGGADTLRRLSTWNGDVATYGTAPDRIPIQVPDDGMDYTIYFAVLDGADLPRALLAGSIDVTPSFYPAAKRAVAGNTYSVYILRDGQRVTAADNGGSFGVAY